MKVSVALCTYNGEEFLAEQLTSLVNQTHPPDEIVICDDGSSDTTLEIIQSFQANFTLPITLHRNDVSLGVFKNFQKCIGLCQYPLVFTCDQDDVWLSNKIEKHITEHEAHPQSELVYSNAEVVSYDLMTMYYLLWQPEDILNQDKGVASFDKLIVKGQSIAGCCMSFYKSFYDSVLPIPPQIYHDDWIATTAFLSSKITGIPEPLMKYRQHGNNVVGIVRGSRISFYKSLFTNAIFYMKADAYIAKRHEIIYQAIMTHKKLAAHSVKYPLINIIELFNNRAITTHATFFESFMKLNRSLLKGHYGLLKGGFTYIKDLYNLFYYVVYKVRTKSPFKS